MLKFDKPLYIKWLKEKDVVIDNNHKICCFELNYDMENDLILDDWAKHIRRHYIGDDELDELLNITGTSKYDFLSKNIIPDKDISLGSTTISGEFAEILTYDIREHIFGEESLRGRNTFKSTPEQGITGSDVLTYKLYSNNASSLNDTLYVTESKAILSKTDYSVITKACNDSLKDSTRYAITLNFLARLYLKNGDKLNLAVVSRFINSLDIGYRKEFEGSATTSANKCDENRLIQEYGNDTKIKLIIFVYGKNLLELAKKLYERACYV